LRKDGRLLGHISVTRSEVRPFAEKEIALLENFAAQAVIAIENARLITETREALAQQTATAEVLGVINSSPGDLAPVFDSILEKAHSLCGIAQGSLELYDGERFRAVAVRGLSDAFADMLRQGYPASDHPATRLLIEGARFVHFPNVAEIDHPIAQAGAKIGGSRTVLFVPLRRDDAIFGLIAAGRLEVRPFSEKQIALLQNFAAQAVIAMENARLLGELRDRTSDLEESLEYQTATSDVLKVISQSGAEIEPVLQTLVKTAARICNADKAVLQQLRDGFFRMGASCGFSQEYKDYRVSYPITPDRSTPIGRMVLQRGVVHIEDVLTDQEYADDEAQRLGEFRTTLAVPLFRDDAVIGGLFLARSRVERFNDKQVQLVTTFADQAVIAMENARLITETRESL
jgi:GAF domain-containing protein